ncbi:preprotein translocase YajC subunit [Roseovarius sp. MBR-6]
MGLVLGSDESSRRVINQISRHGQGARPRPFVPCKTPIAPLGSRQFAGEVPQHQEGRDPMEAFAQFIPLILIFAIMYLLLIRPQQKKMKEHKAMVAALRRGDQVITQGGLIGKVAKVKDDSEIEVELAEGVKVRVVRHTIAQVVSKTEPAEG